MFGEASLGVMGIHDIWVQNYRDMGYLENRFGDIKAWKVSLLKEWNEFIDQYGRLKSEKIVANAIISIFSIKYWQIDPRNLICFHFFNLKEWEATLKCFLQQWACSTQASYLQWRLSSNWR